MVKLSYMLNRSADDGDTSGLDGEPNASTEPNIVAAWSSGEGLRIDDVARQTDSGTFAVASSILDSDVWSGCVDLVEFVRPGRLESLVAVELASGAASTCWCSQHMCCVACDDGDVVCVTRGGNLSGRLAEHDAAASCIAYDDIGGLASGSTDETVKVWDLETANSTQTFRHRDAVLAIAWRCRLLFAGDEASVSQWDIGSGKRTARIEIGAACALFAVERALYVGLESGDVVAFDDRMLPHPLASGHVAAVGALALSSRCLISAGNDSALTCYELCPFRILHRQHSLHADNVRGLTAWDDKAHGDLIATAAWDGRLLVRKVDDLLPQIVT